MCRWLGYVGSPIEPRELLYDTERSLIEQSRRHAPDMPVPNGDGFGLGWYGRRDVPALFHSATPAWGDRNLHTLASEILSPLFLAHVRAATGTPVQETNCHPFAHGRWMFVHNGYVDGYDALRRDMLLAVRPDLFGGIKGTTDSELMFHLALTFGLEADPVVGLERMAGFVEDLGARAGIGEPLQMTVGVTDGERLWAARYASGPVVNTLYYSANLDALRELYPANERLAHFGGDSRAVVSEPLAGCPDCGTRCPRARSSSSRRGGLSSRRSGRGHRAEPGRARCGRCRRRGIGQNVATCPLTTTLRYVPVVPVTGERFIPFRKKCIVTMCADELPAEERASFQAFVEVLASLLHHEFRARLETLKDTYYPFNPDSDTRTVVELDATERQVAQQRLVDELTALAEDANFERISSDDLGRAFVEESLMKVRLEADFDDFEQVVFYRRGEHTRREEVKYLFGLRRRTIEFTNYGKVLVYVKFKDAAHFESAGKNVDALPFTPGSTIIKLFQDVPRADLEMLFPNARVRMRPIDKLLIGVPAVVSGVIVVVTKLVASLIPVLLLLAFWLGMHKEPVQLNQSQLVALGAGLMAFGGYLVRQFTKFKNRKIQFMKALSENLYFRNLDNDAGVFHHLLDAAEEEEVKEAVLAYHFLRTAGRPLTAAELDRRIEDWFAERWDAVLDFEVDDGVGKLRRLRLVADDGQGRLAAVTLDEAKSRLDQIWDDLFAYHAPRTAEA